MSGDRRRLVRRATIVRVPCAVCGRPIFGHATREVIYDGPILKYRHGDCPPAIPLRERGRAAIDSRTAREGWPALRLPTQEGNEQ